MIDLGASVVVAVFIWTQHQQFMAGYDNWLFGWKTPEEKALRAAIIEKARKEISDNNEETAP